MVVFLVRLKFLYDYDNGHYAFLNPMDREETNWVGGRERDRGPDRRTIKKRVIKAISIEVDENEERPGKLEGVYVIQHVRVIGP